MRSMLWWLCATTAAAALGCAGSAGTAVDAPPIADPLPHGTQVSLGDAYETGSGTVMPLGLYTISLDTTGLAASVEPKQVRSIAEAGSDIYALCVSDFFPTPPMRISLITLTGNNLRMGYTVTHPFAAPTNTAGPASASNRADLGIQGSCVFLCDGDLSGGVPVASSYFDGETVMNTGIVTNAHGYTEPGELLDLTGFTCNTFPYRVLVDETDPDCRTVTATGTSVTATDDTGNYVIGWDLSTMGPNNAGWTGYGVLHQGQTASSTVDLDLEGIEDFVTASGSFSLDVALLATYNDPRGGTTAADKKRNRLPSSPPNVDSFFYDMPRAASPMERVTFADQTWDTVIPTGAFADVSCVTWKSTATCTVTMSSLEVFGPDPITFTTSPTGDGTPSSPLSWRQPISSFILPSCPSGEYDICVRIENTTPEVSIALDCTLAPVAGGSPSHRTKAYNGHVTVLK